MESCTGCGVRLREDDNDYGDFCGGCEGALCCDCAAIDSCGACEDADTQESEG